MRILRKQIFVSGVSLLSLGLGAQSMEVPKEVKQDFVTLLAAGANAGYSIGNLFGGSGVPTFRGVVYSGNVEYIIGRRSFSIAPYFEYRYFKLQNTANTSSATDTWKQNFIGGGLRAYSYGAFLKAGYGKSEVTETVTGTGGFVREAHPNSLVLGGGMSWAFPPFVRLEMGVDLMHTLIEASSTGFVERHDLFNYTAHLGLKFVIDSGYKRIAKKQ